MKEFIKENSSLGDFSFKSCSSAQEAVEGADIINVVTSSPIPVVKVKESCALCNFEGEWIKKGAHINAVGACTPNKRELDTDCVKKATVFVDSRESALAG